MFRLKTAETLPLTPELAKKHMDMEPSPTERRIDRARIKYLKEKASAGQLVTFNWAQAKIGEKLVRMNGQHSSIMLNDLNGQFPEGLHVHLDTYEVDANTDLALLFRQFDARKSSRTASDVSGAYQGLYDDLAEVSLTHAKLAVEGIAFWERYIFGDRTHVGDEQYTIFNLQKHHPFIRWIGELYSVKTPEMQRAPIVAALYATYGANETAAKTFWGQVARGGVEYEDGAPSTVLDTWLKAAEEKTSRARPPKPAEFYQGCLYAWNAYREEREIKDIKFRVDKGFHEVTH